MQMAGLQSTVYCCEVTNQTDTMAKAPEIVTFGKMHNFIQLPDREDMWWCAALSSTSSMARLTLNAKHLALR